MMKEITALFFLIAVAGFVSAGERDLVTASVGTIPAGQRGNGTLAPIVTEKYEYYEVCGCCEKDLKNDLKKKCIRWDDGRKYDSVTNWKLKWKYGYTRAPEACAADSFTVTADITFQVPKWVSTGDAPQPLVKKWDAYIDNLMTHERGHRDMAVEAAADFTNEVAALPPARTCVELDREIHALGQARMKKLLEDQKAYDAETNHGLSQGAAFP